MNGIGRARPGRLWAEGCECREVLVDYENQAVHHPYHRCPFYGQMTGLVVQDTAPL